MLPEPTPEQIRAEEQRLLREALDALQQAQDLVGLAAARLSNFEHGAVVWKASTTLYDRVHAFWYRVEAFRKGGGYKLDSLARESLAKRLALEPVFPAGSRAAQVAKVRAELEDGKEPKRG